MANNRQLTQPADKKLIDPLNDMLSFDVVADNLSPFLDVKSICNSQLVAQHWNAIFKMDAIWKIKLKQDFNIISSKLPESEAALKSIYGTVYKLASNLNRMRKHEQALVHYQLTPNLLVALATDDFNLFKESAPRGEFTQWTKIATFAGCKDIPLIILDTCYQDYQRMDVLNDFAKAGNLAAIKQATKPGNRYGCRVNESLIYHACMSGKTSLVKYLIEQLGKKMSSTLCDHIFTNAIKSGSVELAQFILHYNGNEIRVNKNLCMERAYQSQSPEMITFVETNIHNEHDPMTLNAQASCLALIKFYLKHPQKYPLVINVNVLNNLALHGDSAGIAFLLNPENGFELRPEQATLNMAAHSGSLATTQLLLSSDDELAITQETLKYAAHSGNLELVNFLLTEQDDLIITLDIIHAAARSGNLKLLMHLIQISDIKPDQVALDAACIHGHYAIAKFMLDPNNHFNITLPNERVLDEASTVGNTALTDHLLMCQIGVNNAILILSEDNTETDAARQWLMQASYAAPSHFATLVKYIAENREQYDLSEEAHAWFTNQEEVSAALKINEPTEKQAVSFTL